MITSTNLHAAQTKLFALLICGLVLGCRPSTTPAPRESIRQILLISIDTCRSDHLSCYGFTRPTTPHLDTLAKESVLFERTISPVPLTLPAHCSMLTGTNPTHHGVHDNHDFRLADDQTTLAELVKQQGYATGAIVSAFVLDSQFGLDQGFDEYQDEMSGEHLVHGSFNERKGDQTTELALQWLDQHHGDDFFLLLHYFDPHEEYAPPEPFANKFRDDAYAGEIAFTDDCIGRVLEKLKELDLYETTLVMVVGDHGELLGEHGEPSHTYFIYRAAVEVPWIVKLPRRVESRRVEARRAEARRITDTAGLIDVLPTVCGLLDIEAPAHVQGIDWSDHLLDPASTAPVQRAIYCESFTSTKYGATPLMGVVDNDGWKYIHAPRAELFDLNRDPDETHNLIDEEVDRARVLEAELEDLIAAAVNPGDLDGELEMTDEARRRLESLGYVGGSTDLEISSFDADSVDPKDTFEFHLLHQEVTIHLLDERYEQAASAAERMVRDRPESPLGHKHLAKIALDQGQLLAAQTHLETLVRLVPDDVESHTNLGVIYRAQGQMEEGEAAYRRAIAIDPGHAPAQNNLAFALLTKREFAEAIEHLQLAIEVDPDYEDAHFNLGRAFHETGQLDQAVRHFRRVIELKGEWLPALNPLAWLLATRPDANPQDAAEAVRLAKRAAALTENQDAPILDTLAAAYAADGQYDLAITAAEQAIEIATRADAKDLADIIRTHLELFKKRQPYVEAGSG